MERVYLKFVGRNREMLYYTGFPRQRNDEEEQSQNQNILLEVAPYPRPTYGHVERGK